VRRELSAAPGADAQLGRAKVLAAAMGVEGRGAIRTGDAEILQPVVVGNPVDVIENHRHPVPTPSLILAAQLATPSIETSIEQALLEVLTGSYSPRIESLPRW
jgi:hypothetical protein